jgi:hypothetical protein
MRTQAAAGKRKRQEPSSVVHHHADIKKEADVHSESSGAGAEGGAPAADATFADQALDLWFDHEGSPFTESDEEFMPFV